MDRDGYILKMAECIENIKYKNLKIDSNHNINRKIKDLVTNGI